LAQRQYYFHRNDQINIRFFQTELFAGSVDHENFEGDEETHHEQVDERPVVFSIVFIRLVDHGEDEHQNERDQGCCREGRQGNEENNGNDDGGAVHDIMGVGQFAVLEGASNFVVEGG